MKRVVNIKPNNNNAILNALLKKNKKNILDLGGGLSALTGSLNVNGFGNGYGGAQGLPPYKGVGNFGSMLSGLFNKQEAQSNVAPIDNNISNNNGNNKKNTLNAISNMLPSGSQFGDIGMQLGNLGSSIIDSAEPKDTIGNIVGKTAGKDAFAGAGAGSKIGSYFGPLGTAIGAGVGAIGGGLYGMFQGGKEQYNLQQQGLEQQRTQQQMDNTEYFNKMNTNPSAIYGNRYNSYFKYGGNLKRFDDGGYMGDDENYFNNFNTDNYDNVYNTSNQEFDNENNNFIQSFNNENQNGDEEMQQMNSPYYTNSQQGVDESNQQDNNDINSNNDNNNDEQDNNDINSNNDNNNDEQDNNDINTNNDNDDNDDDNNDNDNEQDNQLSYGGAINSLSKNSFYPSMQGRGKMPFQLNNLAPRGIMANGGRLIYSGDDSLSSKVNSYNRYEGYPQQKSGMLNNPINRNFDLQSQNGYPLSQNYNTINPNFGYGGTLTMADSYATMEDGGKMIIPRQLAPNITRVITDFNIPMVYNNGGSIIENWNYDPNLFSNATNPNMETFANGGGIHIKKENKGKFTAEANRHGMGVQQFANKVLANKDNYSTTLIKRANFAKNFGGIKKETGGTLTDNINGIKYNSNTNYVNDIMNSNFDDGGNINKNSQYLTALPQGGQAQQMSSDGVAFNGPSHTNGGIQLPNANAEVEGGETMKNDFVFSKKLGFAPIHKKIMKSKGIVESKAMTPTAINTINLLNAKEQELAMQQEQLKQMLNIK